MNTAELIEQQLGIPLQKSPVYTTKELLRHCYKGHERTIRDTTFDLRDLPFYEAARDLVWRRELTPDMAGKYVHHYDKRSAYLSACSSTNTGVGDPVHLADGDDNTHITPGLPGIYRVSWTLPFLGYSPPIIELGQEWVTNDLLVFAQSREYEIVIREAWVFNDYDRVLGNRNEARNWARKLWNAREALRGTEAEGEAKTLALVGVGSFATGKDKYPGLTLIHPNWWCDVVGKARVNMLYNLEKFAQVGCVPVLIEVDGLYFVSRDANYRTAVPGILDRMNMLGGYKYVSSFQLTDDIVEQSVGVTPSKLASIFKGQVK